MASLALPAPHTSSVYDEQILVDALPYLDKDFDNAQKQMALELIQQECMTYRSTKNYLKHMPLPEIDEFLSPLIHKEFERIEKKQPFPRLDMSRYEAPSPAGTSRSGDKNQWRWAIRNSYAQNEHLTNRQVNLELLHEYGAEAHRRWSGVLQDQLRSIEKKVEERRAQVMEIHARRKREQIEAGSELHNLGAKWAEMVTRNYRLEEEIENLKHEVGVEAKRLKLDPNTLEPK